MFKIGLFCQVALGFWVVSYIGGCFNFLSLLYIGEFFFCLIIWTSDFTSHFNKLYNSFFVFDSGVLLSLSVPILYDKYQDQIDSKLIVAYNFVEVLYGKLDHTILRKIPYTLNKEKKTQ